MPEFVCKIGAPGGEILEKAYVFDSAPDLKQHLESQGFYVFRIERRNVLTEAAAGLFQRRARKVDQEEFLLFNQEFAALVKAGLPILQGLEIVVERMKEGVFREALNKIVREVREGKTLSQAFQDCGDLFPPIYFATLHAGERSGNLHEVLTRYIRYSRLLLETRRRIGSMLIYPAILSVVAGIVISILMFFALPRFASLYHGQSAELPGLTLAVIAVSGFLGRNAVFIVAGAVAFFAAYKSYARMTLGRIRLDAFKLRLPLFGPLIVKFNAAHFSRTLATLLGGGIPAVQALEVAGSSLGNAWFSSRLVGMVGRVREGAAIHAALEETGLFENIALEMVKVGESTGALTEMLHNLADFYDQDIDVSLKRVITVVEPAILLCLAVLVGTILISLYLPIFESIKTV